MSNKETLQNYNTNLGENNETLFSILEIINELPEAGGDGIATPTSLTELEQGMVGVIENYIDYLFDYVDTYETYTNEPITMYAPAETHKYYIIRKRGTNNYGIAWFPKSILSYYSSSLSIANGIQCTTISILGSNEKNTGFAKISSLQGMTMYTSSSFTTPEECIQAIQDPNTVYTSASNNSLTSYMEGDYLVPYTNLPCMTKTYELALSRKISSDETIEVISTTE